MSCQESEGNHYDRQDGIEKLFIGPIEKSNLEYLSLQDAGILQKTHLDALIEHFIADHPTLKEVDLSISIKDRRLGPDDEGVFLRPELGIRSCSIFHCYHFVTRIVRIPTQAYLAYNEWCE